MSALGPQQILIYGRNFSPILSELVDAESISVRLHQRRARPLNH